MLTYLQHRCVGVVGYTKLNRGPIAKDDIRAPGWVFIGTQFESVNRPMGAVAKKSYNPNTNKLAELN